MGLGITSEEISHNVTLGLAKIVINIFGTGNYKNNNKNNNNTKNRETEKRIYNTTLLHCLIKTV